MKVFVFVLLILPNILFAKERFNSSIYSWNYQTLKQNNHFIHRAFINSTNRTAIFSIDIKGQECTDVVFKVHSIQSEHPIYNDSFFSFFTFFRNQQPNTSFFMKSSIDSSKEDAALISKHMPSGDHNTLSAFWNALTSNHNLTIQFPTKNDQKQEFSFSLHNAQDSLLTAAKLCQRNKKKD